MASSAPAQQAAPAKAPAAADKLALMRAAMASADGGRGVHAFIVPSEDPHMVRCWKHGSRCPSRPRLRLASTGQGGWPDPRARPAVHEAARRHKGCRGIGCYV